MILSQKNLLAVFLGDRKMLAVPDSIGGLSYPDEHLPDLGDLMGAGFIKVRVTNAGLQELAKDGLVEVRGVRHLIECEIVQLAARGARRRGTCTCGSAPVS